MMKTCAIYSSINLDNNMVKPSELVPFGLDFDVEIINGMSIVFITDTPAIAPNFHLPEAMHPYPQPVESVIDDDVPALEEVPDLEEIIDAQLIDQGVDIDQLSEEDTATDVSSVCDQYDTAYTADGFFANKVDWYSFQDGDVPLAWNETMPITQNYYNELMRDAEKMQMCDHISRRGSSNQLMITLNNLPPSFLLSSPSYPLSVESVIDEDVRSRRRL
jgi:hypothetical protein